MSIDFRTEFKFTVDGEERSTVLSEDPAAGLDAFLSLCQEQGLDISDTRRKQLVELLRFGRVTIGGK